MILFIIINLSIIISVSSFHRTYSKCGPSTFGKSVIERNTYFERIKFLNPSNPSFTRLNVAAEIPLLSLNERESELRKWFLLNYQRRADTLFVVDSAHNLLDVHAEVWKGVLVSLRVLEKDDDVR